MLIYSFTAIALLCLHTYKQLACMVSSLAAWHTFIIFNYSMNKNTWVAVVFLFAICRVFAQPSTIDEVIAAPSKEIYDLLQDNKGFIWIADELGVRRYDGVAFTNYSHPLQSSLSMTDLVEDRQGRIWCHNFNGQIFYIENEQMHLLEAYNPLGETTYPRIAIYGNDLLATSSKGLFVCNTKSLACKYIPLASPGISSLCIVNNEVVFHGDKDWYVYNKDKGITRLIVNNEIFNGYNIVNLALQPDSKGDTVYAISNPGGLFITFTFSNEQLKLQSLKVCNSFVNAVTIDKEEAWLHTKTGSISLTNNAFIKDNNLTCIIRDREGNRWYSSLEKGLMVTHAPQPWSIVKDSTLDKDDFIKAMKQSKDYLVMGSQQGVLLVKDKISFKTIKRYVLPASAGAIDKIEVLPTNNFLISAAAGFYLLQPDKGKLKWISNLVGVKDLAYKDSILYLGVTMGILQAKIDTASGEVFLNLKSLFKGTLRCRAVKYNSVTGSLWMAYKDGLFKWHQNKLEQVLYKGEPIFASSLEYSQGKIYAGTFSGNLLVIEEKGSGKYVFQKYTFNSAIVRMKLYENHLWLFNALGLHTLDINRNVFIYNQNILYLNGSEIWDATEVAGEIYLATMGRLYRIPAQSASHIHPPSLYLQYVTVNNRDTIFNTNGVRLSHSQNNLSFYIATPWYNRNNNVSIRYRLASTNDEDTGTAQWYNLEINERIIQFNALAPGNYTLTIEAGINDNFQSASLPLLFSFAIIRPWYSQWWFYVLIAAVLATVLYSLYRYRINQLLKLERLRREISSNLHDEVGSTVSSINIYSQLIKNGQHSSEYIDMIQANTVQVMNSLDELVWNINPKYDTLEQLINKMKLFAIPFFNDNNITCHFDATTEKENKILPPEVRTDVYLVLKEAVNNIVKHAQCTRCDIYILQKGKHLSMCIKDNGRGFDVNKVTIQRNGLTTMQYRAKKLKGNLNVISEPGNGTEITLSCNMNSL